MAFWKWLYCMQVTCLWTRIGCQFGIRCLYETQTILIHHSLALLLSADYDPQVVEQKELAPPASLPLSYVLRYISDDARKEPSTFLINNTSSNNNSTSNAGSGNAGNAELKRKLAIKHHSYSMSSSNRSNTPTGKHRIYSFNDLASELISYLALCR